MKPIVKWNNIYTSNKQSIVRRKVTHYEESEPRWWQCGDASTIDVLMDSLAAPLHSNWVADEEVISSLEVEQSPAELEFEKQIEAFKKIPPSELEPYQGQFVAVLDGEIVDSDSDPIELSRRFFEKYGGVPVYKTRIGKPMVVNIPAPFLR